MEHVVPQHIRIGKIGENIACEYLESKGYKIIERNFRRKWGEIDIVCKKRSDIFNTNNKQVIHKPVLKRALTYFKNVLCRTNNDPIDTIFENKIVFVEVKTLKSENLNPEDNVTQSKQKKLIRTCELYLVDKKFDPDVDWQIDVIAIKLDKTTKKADVNHIENAVYYF